MKIVVAALCMYAYTYAFMHVAYADSQPNSTCTIVKAADGTVYYSNCFPPSEHSARDNASAS